MPQQLPKTVGVRRKRVSSNLHKVVKRGLKNIAKSEDKTVSYVLAEIVYAFFGLKVTKSDVIRLEREIHQPRKAKVIHFKHRKVS